MNELREELIEKLKHNRPHISESSIKTYISNLISLIKKLHSDYEYSFFEKHEPIIKFLDTENLSLQTKKTALSALYILTHIKEYRDTMIKYCNQVNDKYKEQKLSDKQKLHRLNFEEVKLKVHKCLLELKENATIEHFKMYLAGVFSSGYYSPPRRSEFCNVKIKNYDINHDNYLLKKKIIFNNYKTFKKYGSQSYDIPEDVYPILKKYLKVNKSDYLFTKNDNRTVMTNTDYNRLLQKVFGKYISVDALRSIYLSEKYKDVPAYTDMEDTARAMGNSINTALSNYVKKD